MEMRKNVNLEKGRSLFIYTFWGNPSLLKEIVREFCRLKGLKRREGN